MARQNRRGRRGMAGNGLACDVQPGELALPDLHFLTRIVNGGIKTDFAVAVAMHVSEMNVPRTRNPDGPWKGLERTNHTIGVKVGKGDVIAIVDLNRQGKAAFTSLLF